MNEPNHSSIHDPNRMCFCGHNLRKHQTEHGDCGRCDLCDVFAETNPKDTNV